MAPAITITEFTDPGCPWAYSAEPARLRVKWLYGEEIDWNLCMVGLSESTDAFLAAGFTPERMASGMAEFATRYGMPFDTTVRPLAATVPACRAVIAARRNAPEREWRLLRALRVRAFGGALLDQPATIDAAAVDAGIDPHDLALWIADPATDAALAEDIRLARSPSAAALALDHKLADSADGRRYTCPSYEIGEPGGRSLAAPGFQPAAVYETLIANLAPGLPRREPPAGVEELLEWCEAPPSTAEVAAVLGIEIDQAREKCSAVATLEPVGADGFWHRSRPNL